MRFMVMMKADKDYEAGIPPPPELMAAVGKASEEMARAGILVGTGGLAPTSMGAKLRLSGGNVVVTDGPFAETKEVIGGYAILEAASKEEAIEMARRFLQLHADVLGPAYETEAEVRRMFDASDFASANR